MNKQASKETSECLSERKNLVVPGYNKSSRDKSIRNSHACEFNEEGREFGSRFLEFMRPEHGTDEGTASPSRSADYPCH